jgi:hypothetical protein
MDKTPEKTSEIGQKANLFGIVLPSFEYDPMSIKMTNRGGYITSFDRATENYLASPAGHNHADNEEIYK